MKTAVLSGFLAATGSLMGKFSGLIENSSVQTALVLKLVCLVLMVISNTLGCTFFVKSLQKKCSSFTVTLTSSATNYFCSVLMGTLIFNESTSLTWWTGTFSVLIGLILICNAENSQDEDKNK